MRVERGQLGKVLGEIVVIILGVLVALAADRALQESDGRGAAGSYVERLLVDLAADSAEYGQVVLRAQTRASVALQTLRLVDGEAAPDSLDLASLPREI